jgi:hypothetical protein
LSIRDWVVIGIQSGVGHISWIQTDVDAGYGVVTRRREDLEHGFQARAVRVGAIQFQQPIGARWDIWFDG